jgi:serine/threonine protein kinase
VDDVNALFFYEKPTERPEPPPTLNGDELRDALGADYVRPLGRGAFGETWETRIGESSTAVKVVLREDYPRQLLAREIGGLQRVNSGNVVRLQEIKEVNLKGHQHAALVFEYIAGGDAAGRMRGDKWPTYEDTRGFLHGILTGVAALHSTGTVHRDIKPENIALRNGNWAEPVLLDLGLAKMLDAESLTTYPQLIGTIPFMSPEQVRGEPARKGADIWAVGVVAYLLLTGSHPFYGGREAALLRSDAHDQLMGGPKGISEEVPEPLRSLVLRLLNGDVHLRGSAQRALRDLSIPQ